MSFSIIHEDITRVSADAIVNTANPKPAYGNGVDHAIYFAAGVDELLAERRKIGVINRGEVAVTQAFSLDAKYIIHTVGPWWEDGEHGEFEILHSCYNKSLKKADELGCKSIAFPLIATGVYGFPRDKALRIALDEIHAFLMEKDIEVILVIFDPKVYELTGKLYECIPSKVDDDYVSSRMEEEYIEETSADEDFTGADSTDYYKRRYTHSIGNNTVFSKNDTGTYSMGEVGAHIDAMLAEREKTFSEMVLYYIDSRGLKGPDVYNAVGVSRKIFSNIQCHPKEYHPKKSIAVSLCIGLKLNIKETLDLLARAGYTLSNSSKSELLVKAFITHGICDIYEIDECLCKYNLPCIEKMI